MGEKKVLKVLKTALLYGEGKHENTFLSFLLDTEKFKVLEKDWFIDSDHASGCSAKDVLLGCIKAVEKTKRDVVLCFIDTDDLKHDFPENYAEKKTELEIMAAEKNIEIVWQEKNLEDVLRLATGGEIKKKGKLKKDLKKHQEILMRSEAVKSIFKRFYNKEE